PCTKPVYVKSKGWCLACNRWSRKNGGADPNGRSPRHLRLDPCPVVFDNGEPCPERGGYRKSPWCRDCYDWSKRHGGVDPSGRRRWRAKGEVRILLREAASAMTDDCIIMTGYSRRPNVQLGRRWVNASRAVWMLANGDPGELSVLHTCHRGDEGCINIRHLYLGDQARNVQDMVEAERQNRGEEQWYSVAEEEGVCEIRRLLNSGMSHNAIAAQLGLTRKIISGIADRTTWDWLKCCPDHAGQQHFGRVVEVSGKPSLTMDQAAEVRALAKSGVKQTEIAAMFGVSKMTISRTVRGERYVSRP